MEKIQNALKKHLETTVGSLAGTAFYYATLPSSAEEMPEGGRLVTVPVPEGTTPEEYLYHISAMYTTDAAGKTPGEIEKLKVAVKRASDGRDYLEFYLTGDAALMVGWQENEAETSESAAQTENTASEPSEGELSEGETSEGRKSNTDLWIGIGAAIAAALGILIIFLRKKNDNESES